MMDTTTSQTSDDVSEAKLANYPQVSRSYHFFLPFVGWDDDNDVETGLVATTPQKKRQLLQSLHVGH